jgi:hypothetical protein
LFNFMLLDKPAVIYSPPFEVTTEQERVRRALLERACLRATEAGQVASVVRRALDSPAMRSDERRHIAQWCFSHFGSATPEALNALRAELGRA